MPVTIKDIARKVGVTHATVSLVLSGNKRISPKTSEKVLRAARELNYLPNLAARNLRRGSGKAIAFVVNDITNPFYALMIQSAEATALARGYPLLVADGQWDPEKEIAAVERVAASQVKGVILCCSEKTSAPFKILARAKIPVITVDSCPADYKGALVGNDAVMAGRMAAEHLLDMGCDAPLFLTADRKLESFSGFVGLKQGFLEGLKKRKISAPSSRVINAGMTIEDGRNAFHRLRSQTYQMNGIFCCSDLCALGVITAAEEARLRIGRDLAVVGIDDLEISSLPRISLTSLRQPHAEIARLATEALIDSIEQQKAPSIRQTFSPELIVRDSTRLFSKK